MKLEERKAKFNSVCARHGCKNPEEHAKMGEIMYKDEFNKSPGVNYGPGDRFREAFKGDSLNAAVKKLEALHEGGL